MRFFPHIQIFSRLYNLPPRQAFWSSRRPDSLAITISRLNDSEILLGITKENPHWTLLNHILIAGKQVIHTNRLRKTKPLLPQLIAKLKYIEHIEYFIAKKRDRLKFHQLKWEILKFS